MIDEWAAALISFFIILAGVMELIRARRSPAIFVWAARLGALGFFVFGARLVYIIWIHDITLLTLIGIFSTAAIAISRIITCAQALRQRP